MPGQKLLPVLLALVLVACGKADDDRAGPVGEDGGIPDPGAYSLFDPTAGTVPFPSDFLFDLNPATTDGTLNIPNASGAPFVTAANELDGFSTTASLFTDFIGHVDVDSALDLYQGCQLPPGIDVAGVVIVDTSALPNVAQAVLKPGVDYRVQSSTAIDPGTGSPLNQLRTRMLIEPLKPLKPSTRYVVLVTNAVHSTAGVPAQAADMFRLVRSTTPVNEQNEPILTTLDATKRATLEAIRGQFAQIFADADPLLAACGATREDIVIAWPFTTQSTTKTLQKVAEQAQAAQLTAFNGGVTTDQALQLVLGENAPPVELIKGGDIYGGMIELPYYSAAPTQQNPTAPLTAYWLSKDVKDGAALLPALGGAPCAALTNKSASTTTCYPEPLQQSLQTVPVLMTVPNADSGLTMPQNGWPVVIFQHGITGNRSMMLPLAPALSKAGFAVVAIDLPLHGVVTSGPNDPLNAVLVPGTTERTFSLDLVNNDTSAPGPDGKVDASGTHFINLTSLLTSRDNLRQASADLVVLAKSVGGATLLLPPLNAPTPANVILDGSRVHFVGHSLGGIVGTPFLGVSSDVTASVLAMPGGGIAKLLDGSMAFGPRIAAGLQAASAANPPASQIIEGNDNYETFLRFAQTLVDSGDPLNFAALAAQNHPILMYTVQGDEVVPNCTIKDDPVCPATDTLTVSGYLSGSYPLARTLGLEFKTGDGPDDVLTPPLPISCDVSATGHLKLLRYGAGDHASILSPGASPAVTQEMQRTLAVFLASNGTMLQMGSGVCVN